ncbi:MULTISPECIES: AAA family ATPase [unclassified Shewanella]|uniref:AAA family ATPase n=1 Tax=Shewanella TaxID=22 RepID=UPI000E95B48C|nr:MULTISPECIES: AAA family ATPase [unclassified Shewanella]MCU8031752.1 AAA family ATPase [Shewanella sp. SM73]HAY92518.1 AAA family ATPase [Shewanella sp.]
MTFQGSVLLPSQEALIQRMHHVASYSDQLLVLSGVSGSGKTTLVTGLATDFDESNAAFVICPMHADNAEIRRKILVQLISSPIFDDDIPLADTLLRLASTQTKPLHIIIDDAHLLPKALWAECIILNQIQCAGKNIAVTLTVPPAFLADLLPQLPEQLRRQILPISIEPLTMPEREALYQTLLRYSDQNPFTPREIVRSQLEKQTGTPQEVVNLLDKALHSPQEKTSSWMKYKAVMVTAVSMLLALGIWLGVTQPFSEEQAIETATFPAIDSPAFLSYGQKILAPYFALRAEQLKFAAVTVKVNELDTSKAKTEQAVDPLSEFHGEAPHPEPDDAALVSVGEVSSKSFGDDEPTVDAEPQAKTVDVQSPAPEAAKVDKTVLEPQKPLKGYTVQIASVAQLETLRSTLKSLENVEGVRVAKYKQRWVVLVGHYSSSKLASNAAAQLVKEYRFEQPWVRKWADLKDYQVEESLSNREISE